MPYYRMGQRIGWNVLKRAATGPGARGWWLLLMAAAEDEKRGAIRGEYLAGGKR